MRDFTLHLNDRTIILTFYGREFVHDENSQCLSDRDCLANSAFKSFKVASSQCHIKGLDHDRLAESTDGHI